MVLVQPKIDLLPTTATSINTDTTGLSRRPIPRLLHGPTPSANPKLSNMLEPRYIPTKEWKLIVW